MREPAAVRGVKGKRIVLLGFQLAENDGQAFPTAVPASVKRYFRVVREMSPGVVRLQLRPELTISFRYDAYVRRPGPFPRAQRVNKGRVNHRQIFFILKIQLHRQHLSENRVLGFAHVRFESEGGEVKDE